MNLPSLQKKGTRPSQKDKMPQRFYEDEYEDAESVYSEQQEEYYEEDEEVYEESPAPPYEEERPLQEEEEEEEEYTPDIILSTGAESWQTLFHSLRGASDPLPNTVTWTEMRSFLNTLCIEPFPPRAPAPLFVEPRALPETSSRVERLAQELTANEEAYKVLRADLKDLTHTLQEAMKKQVDLAAKFAEQEKKKPYKWGPPSKKVVTPLEAELKNVDAEILVLREKLSKTEDKGHILGKELVHDRKNLEEEKEMWEVYKKYTAFEHTLVGPVLQ